MDYTLDDWKSKDFCISSKNIYDISAKESKQITKVLVAVCYNANTNWLHNLT